MTTDLEERLSDLLHTEAAGLVPDRAAPLLPAREGRRAGAWIHGGSRWRAPALAAVAVVAIAAVTTIAVAQRRDGGATHPAGPGVSSAAGTTTAPGTSYPHLSPLRDDPAAPFDCGGRATLAATRTGTVMLGITSTQFCVTGPPTDSHVDVMPLEPGGRLRTIMTVRQTTVGVVDPTIDGLQWVPNGPGSSATTTVDLYRLGALRGFAFDSGIGSGTLVLYSGQTVVQRFRMEPPVSNPASSIVGSGTERASRSSPPGQGPSPEPGAWPTNARGQTYGRADDTNAQGRGPDLVAAIATNGRQGYVLATELSGPMPTSLADAAVQNSAPSRTIPVYLSDGVTQIGVFVVTGR